MIFEGIGAEERAALRGAARRRRFARSEVVFHEGDPGESLHVVGVGHVAVRVSTAMGDVGTVAVLGPGQVFGEQALLEDSGRRAATVVCLDRVETLSIGRRDFEELRRKLPALDRFLVEVLSARLTEVSNVLLDHQFLDAQHRIYRCLCALAEVYRTPDGSIELGVTQDDIASMTGSTRSTVNRALKAAQQAGAVSLRRGRISLTDQDWFARKARR